ncbi:MAG: peptidoglycan-binding protein [Lachnospiraceae bacterium]|nr:peptidoglycan-binding protein [Lachnospiraceae bacterium]
MSDIIIGSARMGENGKITGGKPGDQKQTKSTSDYNGEVSLQKFYIHKKGWVILRAKQLIGSEKLAEAMKTACNNPNIGYNQDDRYGVIKHGVATKKKCNSDCSSLVRACVIYATGKDVGDFSTSDEAAVLVKSGLFDKVSYKAGDKLYAGDILVTKTKGHTVIVVSSPDSRKSITYPTIKKGYKDSEKGGSFCKLLQHKLNQIGITDNSGKRLSEDGSCGAKTAEAIKRFQKKYGLSVDGSCGPKTWAAINSMT